MSILLGIDTGGTYTDAVLFDLERGVLASAKALTTRHDLTVGIGEALQAVLSRAIPASGTRSASGAGTAYGAGAAQISLVSLSTTLATNAIVERQGSPICLFLLGYPPDSLSIGGLGQALGRDPVVFLKGGHTISGSEQAPLDLAEVDKAIRKHAPHVAAFAISGYFGVLNPAHELMVRRRVQELCGLPATCGHELSSHLHAPRRALTAALNARLIPYIRQLIQAVQQMLTQAGIQAPLMVVKGDGSLMDASLALERPVETILSGPAASVVGARYLSGEPEVMVVDMGGTTTDIALLQDGRPALCTEGATVGGWRTMVEAIDVHTTGLGGDSEVHFDAERGLLIGPRRVTPLCLLAQQHPQTLDWLAMQAERETGRAPTGQAPAGRAPTGQVPTGQVPTGQVPTGQVPTGQVPTGQAFEGQFALRLRPLDKGVAALDSLQAELWELLADGPVPLSRLYPDRQGSYRRSRALAGLVERGLVALSGFTPSDASHVLGYQQHWSIEAARLGAEIWRRKAARALRREELTVEEFCQMVFDQVVFQLGEAVVMAALAQQGIPEADQQSWLQQLFLAGALGKESARTGWLEARLKLLRPLVAVGAPAATYFPPLAERLQTRLIVPEHAGVANAIGAVVGSVTQQARALVRPLGVAELPLRADEPFRLHLPDGVVDVIGLEAAIQRAEVEVRRAALELARRAGAGEIQVQVNRKDSIARGRDGKQVFLDSEIIAIAAGRPRLAEEPNGQNQGANAK